MDIVTIVSLIAGAIAIIAAIAQFLKWLFSSRSSHRPFIDVKIEYVKGTSAPMGIGPNAVPEPGKDYFENATTLHLYKLTKTVKLTLLNNSEITAYYPKYVLYHLSPQIIFEQLDNLVPVAPHASVIIMGEFYEYEEVLPKNRTKVENFPSQPQRQKVKLLVEYQSASRKKYYSEYSGALEATEYLKRMPLNYNLKTNG